MKRWHLGTVRLAESLARLLPVIWTRIGTAAISLGVQLVIARFLLDAAGFGHYAVFVTASLLAAVVIKGGIDTAAIRYLAAYREREPTLEAQFLGLMALHLLASGVAVALAIWLATDQVSLGPVGGVGTSKELLLFGFATWCHSALQSLRGIFVAWRYPVLAELSDGVIRPLLLILSSAAVVGMNGGIDYVQLAELHGWSSLAAVVTSIIGLLVINKKFSMKVPRKKFVWPWLRSAGSMSLNVILRQAYRAGDILVCGALLPATQVGYYAAATRISNVVVMALSSTNMVFAPKLSRCFATANLVGLQRTMSEASRVVFLLGFFAFLGLLLMGDWFLALFGNGFEDAYAALMILASAQLVNSFYGPVGYLASMTGNEVALTNAIIVTMPLAIFAYIILVPQFGIIGAAIGSGVGTAGWNVLLSGALKRKIGIRAAAL